MSDFKEFENLEGVWSRSLKRHPDLRGSFLEIIREDEFPVPNLHFTQDSVSFSDHEVRRGMHLQEDQYQLVTLLQGKITDVLLDLREKSRGLSAVESVILEAGYVDQLLISPGIAHGFAVTSGPAIIHYKSSVNYQATPQYGISCDSPELIESWPSGTWKMSERDSRFPQLKDFLND